MKNNEIWECDFCQKSQREVEKIIVGQNNVAICNRCICASLEIILNAAKDSAIAQVTVAHQPLPSMPKGGF